MAARIRGLGLLGALSILAVALAPSPCRAEEGVAPDAIVISRVIALTGPAGAKGREQEEALKAYFDALNAAGGINGRRIALRTTDLDLRSDALLEHLCSEQAPFALFLFGGTPGSLVAANYATAHHVPFVAPNSGANVFHQPPRRYVFNVRARYQDEVVALTRHFATVNQRRIALVYVDDPFGRDAAQGYGEGIKANGATSVYEEHFAPDGSDLNRSVDALVRIAPDTVIAVGASQRVAELIVRSRKAGVRSTFATLSNNASAGFAQELGAFGRGVIVSQVTPPGTSASRLGRELQQLMGPRSGARLSYAAMEAYASAKVLVEGLRRAGPNLTREGFVRALESLHRLDLGGFEVDYSSTKRSGSNLVELSILSDDGKYRR